MKNLLSGILLFFLTFGMTISAQDREIIEINTHDLSMIFSAAPNENVIFHYWGDKMNETHSFLEQRFKGQPDTSNDMVPQLYPAYGGRFYLTPALKLTHADGVLTTELVYANSQQKRIDDNRTETIITLKDRLYPVSVAIRFIAYQKENIISQSVTISHTEDSVIYVENLASSYIPIHSENYYLTHFHGTWANEMQMEEEKLTHGIKVIETKKGVRATQSENPSFLISLNGVAQEEAGKVYTGALAWSGNYKITFEVDETGTLNILSGMNPFASTFRLSPNEALQTPEMILTYSSKGKGQISRNYHDWARKYAMVHGDQLHPIILNSWEGAYFDFNENTITDMIDDAARFGVEMFVLDDGWFGNTYPRNSDNAGLGDWQVNKKKLPRGIAYLADYAVKKV